MAWRSFAYAVISSMHFYKYKDPRYPDQEAVMVLLTTVLGVHLVGFNSRRNKFSRNRFSGFHGAWGFPTGKAGFYAIWNCKGVIENMIVQVFKGTTGGWQDQLSPASMVYQFSVVLYQKSNTLMLKQRAQQVKEWNSWHGKVPVFGYNEYGDLKQISHFHVWSESTVDMVKKCSQKFFNTHVTMEFPAKLQHMHAWAKHPLGLIPVKNTMKLVDILSEIPHTAIEVWVYDMCLPIMRPSTVSTQGELSHMLAETEKGLPSREWTLA